MKKLLQISLASLALFSASSVLADTPTPEPQKCPGVAALQAGGVSHYVIKINNRWFAGRRHLPYDTTDMWTFIIGDIDAVTADEAYKAAAKGLMTLEFQMGPIPNADKWICLYNTTDPNLPAVTITTPIAFSEAYKYF